MGQLSMTTTEVQNTLDARHTPFIQDIGDATHTVGSPQAVLANTEYRLTIDGAARNFVSSPAFFTDRWDDTNDKMTFSTALNTQTFVSDIGFTFDPSGGSAGTGQVRVYVDDASPKVLRTYTFDYKGSPEPVSIVATYYTGTEAGFDVKNDGIYVTVEFESAGDLYNKTMVIYNT